MKEIKCEVIRDLLPLYEDNAASEETRELVRAHLKDCPACREELRKMRIPITMPPDEDEEAVKRFLEYRAKVRRKQNRKIVCVASILAVLIVFILCYTLIPRSWDIASREADPDRIMGSRHTFTFYHGEPEMRLWTINQEEADGPAVSAFMDALRAGSYRAELRNILNHTPLGAWLDTSVQGSSNTVILALVRDDTVLTSVMLFDTYDHEIQINLDGGTYFYHDDGTLYAAISALVEEYGELQD